MTRSGTQWTPTQIRLFPQPKPLRGENTEDRFGTGMRISGVMFHLPSGNVEGNPNIAVPLQIAASLFSDSEVQTL
jgi:ribosomal protein L16/L10AE